MTALIMAARCRQNRLGAGSGWNQSDKGADFSLSSIKNVIAKASAAGAGGWESIRSVTSHSTGKWFFEVQTLSPTLTQAGVCNSAMSLANYVGAGTGEARGLFYNSGGVIAVSQCGTFANGGAGTKPGTPTLGMNLIFALDVGAKKYWNMATTDAGWANGGNPVAGTTPDATWTTALTLFAAGGVFSNSGNTPSIVLNTGQAPWSNASIAATLIAGGFSPWG